MNIILRTFEASDIDRLVSWIDTREQLLSWAGNFFEYPFSPLQAEQYLATANNPEAARVIFKALDTDTDKVIGHIELDGFDIENNSAFICRVLIGDVSYRGRGIGQTIVKQAVNKAFSDFDLHRLAVAVLDSNKIAIDCYQKCGFRYEGCYRDIINYENKFFSMVSMSLLRHEWKE